VLALPAFSLIMLVLCVGTAGTFSSLFPSCLYLDCLFPVQNIMLLPCNKTISLLCTKVMLNLECAQTHNSMSSSGERMGRLNNVITRFVPTPMCRPSIACRV